ncbi:MAG: PIN domain-containing protein [Candidatus Micrarchaeia archaeon]
MSSDKKTLIIFDTNALARYTNYSFVFPDFGADYIEIENFINNYNLSKQVKTAIPKLVLEEILQQRSESFDVHVKTLEKAHTIFKDFHGVKLSLPNEDYNYKNEIKEKLYFSLKNKEDFIIDFPKSDSFDKMIGDVIERKAPFRRVGDNGDCGFKDALIWASILNYKKINDFDSVIFFSIDTDYDYGICKTEFANKFSKQFFILNSKQKVIEALSEEYGIYTDEYNKFANSTYFGDTLNDYLKEKKFIVLQTGRRTRPFGVLSYEIKNKCIGIIEEKDEFNELTGNRKIESLIEVSYRDGDLRKKKVKVITYIDEIRDVISIETHPELD